MRGIVTQTIKTCANETGHLKVLGYASRVPQPYSAGVADDIRQAVFYNSRVLFFSLGADVMIRDMAEEGKHCLFQSAYVYVAPSGFRLEVKPARFVTQPWDLIVNVRKSEFVLID